MSESGLEAGTVLCVSLVRQVWLEDVDRVSIDTVEKVIVGGVEQVRVWRVETANQDTRGRQPNTFPTMLVLDRNLSSFSVDFS